MASLEGGFTIDVLRWNCILKVRLTSRFTKTGYFQAQNTPLTGFPGLCLCSYIRYSVSVHELNIDQTTEILISVMEYELSGVVRYTHYALMVAGSNRIPIVDFMRGQASESLLHAQTAGELLTGLGGHPSLKVASIAETHNHNTEALLSESLNHEKRSISLYTKLLEKVQGASIYLEEYARQMIAAEEKHCMELEKMLRDVRE
tara:strand:+ start:107 stop:715 length:609 start_codon:yes stop_codon:yes gene_type:complete